MTTVRAIQLTNELLKRDSVPPPFRMTDSQREALAKLVSVATERIFGKNRGSR
jgi:hypothetical protein